MKGCCVQKDEEPDSLSEVHIHTPDGCTTRVQLTSVRHVKETTLAHDEKES